MDNTNYKKTEFEIAEEAKLEATKETYKFLAERDHKWLAKLMPTNLDDFEFLYTLKGKQKVYTLCVENICKILSNLNMQIDVFGFFQFDEFRQVFEYKPIKMGSTWRPMEEMDSLTIQTRIQQLFECFQTVTKGMVYDAIVKVAYDNKYDSAKAYLENLQWDGVARLDTWLCSTYGVDNDVYHRAIASNWMKGLVKRIMQPGCKFDYVMVLEGEQGCKKSMSLATLGGAWHVETTMSTDSKDFFMQFNGKAIVEFSEGETLSRTEVKRMKAIITTQSDKYRPPYERVSKDFPRRCVFTMTTNQEEYLKDETGNRRWFPVKVVLPEADVKWLAENRDQLFAEAYHRVIKLKENCWDFPKEETLKQQQERRIRDANEDIVVDWYLNKLQRQKRMDGVVPRDAFMACYASDGFGNKSMNKYEEMQIANIFREALGLKRMRKMIGGIQANRWYSQEAIDASTFVEAAMKQTMKMDEEAEAKAPEIKEEAKKEKVEEETNAHIPF